MKNGKGNMVLAIAFLAVVILSVTGYTFWQKGKEAETEFIIKDDPRQMNPASSSTSPPSTSQQSSSDPMKPSCIYVHVAGKVVKPAVYRLPLGSRAIDGVKIAGGPTRNANTDAVNLAEKLEDGQQLYIPSKEESSGVVQPVGHAILRKKSAKGDLRKGVGQAQTPVQKLTDPVKQHVNINSATSEQLQQLKGIGPAMAERIIQYRKSIGKFHSADQLMDVQGIGTKKFEQLKPFIRL